MARPRAIYASIPSDSIEEPHWISGPGLTVPVLFSQPYCYWPDLNWLGDLAGDNTPTDYGFEIPQYLWSDSQTVHPQGGESHTFSRQWRADENIFSATTFPPGDYCIVINHAADDQYEIELTVNGIARNPLGGNSFIPSPQTWRNIKTYVYRLMIAPGDIITLTSIVTNDPQPGGVPETNPAMFIWVMQVFNHPLPA